MFIGLCIGLGNVSGAECNGDLSQGGTGCSVTDSNQVFILNGTHNLNINVTKSGSYVNLIGSNITFDCNGSTIYGNNSGSERPFFSSGDYNNTLRNCILNNYGFGAYVRHGSYFTMENIIANNISTGLIDYQNMTHSKGINLTVTNGNIFSGETKNDYMYFANLTANGIYPGVTTRVFTSANLTNSILEDFTFSNVNSGVILDKYSNNITIRRGTIENATRYQAIGMDKDPSGNNNPIHFNWTIEDVTLIDHDSGLWINNLDGILVDNLTTINSTNNYDYYDAGIHIEFNSTNLNFYNINLENFGSVGLLVRQVRNMYVENISCSNDDSVLTGDYTCGATQCQSEPVSCVIIEQSYKGFMPNSWDGGANISGARQHTSYNISIVNMTTTNIPVRLKNQGGVNITFDSSVTDGTWYKAFRVPTWTDKEEFYIDDNFDYPYTILNNAYYEYLFSGPTYHPIINYTFKKDDYDYYQNIFDYNLAELNYDNVTALYNISTNHTVYSITNDQYLFTSTTGRDQFNYTLAPNEEIQVSDYSCTVPYEDMVITEDTTFCSGTYYLNDTGANIAVIIDGNNIILEGNGTTLDGNSTTNSIAVKMQGDNNVTIRNITIQDYSTGVEIVSFNKVFELFNLIINNTISRGINIDSAVNSSIHNNNLSLVGQNVFVVGNGHSIRIRQTQNISVFDNIITNGNYGVFITQAIQGLGNNIYNNVISGSTYHPINNAQSNDTKIYNNNISNFGNGSVGIAIDIETNSHNVSVWGNNITNGYSAITFSGGAGANHNASNNYVNNVSLYGVHYNGASNSIAHFNEIHNAGERGISIVDSVGIDAFNNTVRNSTLWDYLISRSNNTRVEINSSNHDGLIRIYVSQSKWLNFSTDWYDFSLDNQNGTAEINITSSYLWMLASGDEFNITVESLTNALIYNTNGSIYGSSTISENDGNINITLPPNNASYVLDEFNLTEGTTRENNPLEFEYSILELLFGASNDQKKVTSDLVDDITNFTVVLTITRGCEELARIDYASNGGTYTEGYLSTDYSCTDGTITLTASGIESGDDNIFQLTYSFREELSGSCEQIMDGFFSFANLLTLIILAVVVVLLVYLLQGNGIGFKGFFVGSVLTIVLVAIINIIGAILIQAICD